MLKIFRKEEGFTLIEVIVTVAIVLAMAIGGFVSYGSLESTAKQSVTEAAAQQVYDAANVFNQEGSKTPQEASDEFNERHETVTTAVVGENCVSATHQSGQTAERGDGCSSDPPGCKMVVDEWGIGTLECDHEEEVVEEEDDDTNPEPIGITGIETIQVHLEFDDEGFVGVPYTLEITRISDGQRVLNRSGTFNGDWTVVTYTDSWYKSQADRDSYDPHYQVRVRIDGESTWTRTVSLRDFDVRESGYLHEDWNARVHIGP